MEELILYHNDSLEGKLLEKALREKCPEVKIIYSTNNNPLLFWGSSGLCGYANIVQTFHLYESILKEYEKNNI